MGDDAGRGVRLMPGDCLERMGEIESGSVDLIAADLPYGTTSCRWDSVIPLGPMWDAFGRVLKPRGAAVLTASQPFTSALIMSRPDWFKFCWTWDKVNRVSNYGNVRHMPLRRHEDIVVFSGGTPTYNPQMDRGEPYVSRISRSQGSMPGVYAGGGLHDQVGINLGTRYPVSILPIKAKVNAEQGLHPTQKPVALFEYLIRTYSNEGDTVLDCTMGSGTTGVACINTGRNFIGIERDPSYFAIAESRIDAARNATPLLS